MSGSSSLFANENPFTGIPSEMLAEVLEQTPLLTILNLSITSKGMRELLHKYKSPRLGG